MDFRFLVRPMERMEEQNPVLLTLEQLRKILPGLVFRPSAEAAFFDAVEQNPPLSMTPLYAKWLEAEPEIRSEYEEFEKKNRIKKMLWLAKCRFTDRKRGSAR